MAVVVGAAATAGKQEVNQKEGKKGIFARLFTPPNKGFANCFAFAAIRIMKVGR